MKRSIILIVLLLCGVFSAIYSQGFDYEEKVKLSEGVYKVKSGDYYGVVDENGKVVVSIEYQDLLFREGKALLTKDNKLYGIVDTLGKVVMVSGEYRVHPVYRYVYEGYIPVMCHITSRIVLSENKWGYIDMYGQPFRIKEKIKDVKTASKNGPSLFDAVGPVVNGCASVFLEKRGWKHIGVNGIERFMFTDPKKVVAFRSSIHNGECIMVTDDGIKTYQEGADGIAVVKQVLSPTAFFLETAHYPERIIYREGTLTLDSLMRVVKYDNGIDSILFIQQSPRKVVVKKITPVIEQPHFDESVSVGLSSATLQANDKGYAYMEMKIRNTTNSKFQNVIIVMQCGGVSKEWKGDLDANSVVKLSLNIPARFSSAVIKRKASISLLYEEENVERDFSVTIKRYTPMRSR